MFKVKVLVFCIQSLRTAAGRVSVNLSGVNSQCDKEDYKIRREVAEKGQKIAIKATEAQAKVTSQGESKIQGVNRKRSAALLQKEILEQEFKIS